MKHTAKFYFENETRGALRYSEENATDPLIGVLYLKKDGLASAYRADMTVMPGRWPAKITVTVEVDG